MEKEKVLTKEEVLERAKTAELADEELEKITGGTGNTDGWLWTSVYDVIVWADKASVQYIFNLYQKIKIWEFFGGGEDAQIYARDKVYSSKYGGWVDVYYANADGEQYELYRENIVYQG